MDRVYFPPVKFLFTLNPNYVPLGQYCIYQYGPDESDKEQVFLGNGTCEAYIPASCSI